MNSIPLVVFTTRAIFFMGVSFSEMPCFLGWVVYQGELGERAYEVGRSNERATRLNLLRESDSEAQSDHAMLLGRTLAVNEFDR